MSYVSIPTFEELSPLAKQRYQAQITDHGRITNMKKVLLKSVPAFDSLMTWYPLFEQVKAITGEQAALFYAYSISNQNECLICNTFFIKILRDKNIDIETFNFSQQEQALINYGRALVANPKDIDSNIFEQLNVFFDEPTLILLTAFASIMIATNLINTALAIPLDEYLFEYIK